MGAVASNGAHCKSMGIRKADSKDIAAIKKIADLLYLDIPGFDWNDEYFIKGQIEKGEYYLVEKDGIAVGAISLRDRNGRLYIETLAVAKDIQTRGVGTKLVEFAKQFARENGFKILRTTSFYEYGVKDFYIKQGFRLFDEAGEYGGHKFHRLEWAVEPE